MNDATTAGLVVGGAILVAIVYESAPQLGGPLLGLIVLIMVVRIFNRGGFSIGGSNG